MTEIQFLPAPGDDVLPILWLIIPCYNEEDALPATIRIMAELLDELCEKGKISRDSRILFVDDGSSDHSWPIIQQSAEKITSVCGIKLSRNFGHQNALLCGLLQAQADITITIDADLQDDIRIIPDMVDAWHDGADIVLGVRENREVDSIVKRGSAHLYYHILNWCGVRTVFDHADYRLLSGKAVSALEQYGEVNLFLRGLITQLGFRTAIIPYRRQKRTAGETKYSASKMLSLAIDGITSFSVAPLRLITVIGILLSGVSLLISLWAIIVRLFTHAYVPGWASTVIPLYFLGGIQLLSLGIVGEYLGKMYIETKHRPRFIIDKTAGIPETPASRR